MLARALGPQEIIVECPKFIETKQEILNPPKEFIAAKSRWKNQIDLLNIYFDQPHLSNEGPTTILKATTKGNYWTIEGDGVGSLWVSCTYRHTNFELVFEVKKALECSGALNEKKATCRTR